MTRNGLRPLLIASLGFPITLIAATTWLGTIDSDITNPGNWDNGLPTNEGTNNGTVPAGFPSLSGSPTGKNITFEGNSGFAGNDFGGAQANGFNVTFNGTDLTGFNNGDQLNFTPGSTGILNITNANYSIADAEADINAGWITIDGTTVTPSEFVISVVGDDTSISLIPEPTGGLLLSVAGPLMAFSRRR